MIENKNQEIALKSELQKLADEFQVEVSASLVVVLT